MIKEGTLKRTENGFFATSSNNDQSHMGFNLELKLISMAYYAGCDMEDLADGFGKGVGTKGDWSAIRDSSESAHLLMLTRALNFLNEGAEDRGSTNEEIILIIPKTGSMVDKFRVNRVGDSFEIQAYVEHSRRWTNIKIVYDRSEALTEAVRISQLENVEDWYE